MLFRGIWIVVMVFVVMFLFVGVFVEEKMKVVMIFMVIVDMVVNVVGDVVEVVFVIKLGVEIYGYELILQDIVWVYDVDLILWNGMNLEFWFE